MTSIRNVKVSEPYNNPLITVPHLNPIRTYSADVVNDKGKVEEHLSGVAFANQDVGEQIQHHALLRRHGLLEVPRPKSAAHRMERLK